MARSFDDIMALAPQEFRKIFCVVGHPVAHGGKVVLCPEPLQGGEYLDGMPAPQTVWPRNEGSLKGKKRVIPKEDSTGDNAEKARRVALYREAYARQDLSEGCISPLPGVDTRLPRSRGTGTVRINRMVRQSQLVGALNSPADSVATPLVEVD